jgi:prepilin peptidase dependent protein B
MLVKNKLNSTHAQAGVTLIELMISIVLGLLLLGAATAMTVSSMVMNADTLQSARLNQDLDSVLHVMVNDIRRAGYTDNFTAGEPGIVYDTVGSGSVEASEDLNIVSSGCVLYAYNANGDGNKDNEEKFGFKLVGTEVHMRTICSSGSSCATDCSAGNWVPLTDDNVISITSLTFDSVNSKCLNITKDPDIDNNYWVVTSDDTTEFACLETSDAVYDTDNLTNYIPDGTGAYVTGTFVEPDTGDRLIGVRQVNVVIEGELKKDDSMIKKQVVAINVRNNRVTTIVAATP